MKLLLIPLLFIALSCDNDEMEEVGNTIDPFIGTWDLSQVGGGCVKGIVRTTISPDGTWENFDGITGYWLNLGDDFNDYDQTYRWTNSVTEFQGEWVMLFDEDWNSIYAEIYDPYEECGMQYLWDKISA